MERERENLRNFPRALVSKSCNLGEINGSHQNVLGEQ